MRRLHQLSRSAVSSHPLEKLYYEAKPLILTVFAFYGLTSNYSNTFFVKFNILTLFVLAAYVTYSRLLHRGYIKQK
ncbi:MAG: hypothetical protein AABZ31_15215 [Bdellovibrionota bacterium]